MPAVGVDHECSGCEAGSAEDCDLSPVGRPNWVAGESDRVTHEGRICRSHVPASRCDYLDAAGRPVGDRLAVRRPSGRACVCPDQPAMRPIQVDHRDRRMLVPLGREDETCSVRRPRWRVVEGPVRSAGAKAPHPQTVDGQDVDRSRRIEHDLGAIWRPLQIRRHPHCGPGKQCPEVLSGPQGDDVKAVEFGGSSVRCDREGDPRPIACPRQAEDVATPTGAVGASHERVQATVYHGRELVPTWRPLAVIRRGANDRQLARLCDGRYSGPYDSLPIARWGFTASGRPLAAATVSPPEDGHQS
jgi:hypothetical protein